MQEIPSLSFFHLSLQFTLEIDNRNCIMEQRQKWNKHKNFIKTIHITSIHVPYVYMFMHWQCISKTNKLFSYEDGGFNQT